MPILPGAGGSDVASCDWSAGAHSRFHLHKLGRMAPGAAVEEVGPSPMLCLKAEPSAPLSLGRDTRKRDKGGGSYRPFACASEASRIAFAQCGQVWVRRSLRCRRSRTCSHRRTNSAAQIPVSEAPPSSVPNSVRPQRGQTAVLMLPLPVPPRDQRTNAPLGSPP